jgi:hypothetical protein
VRLYRKSLNTIFDRRRIAVKGVAASQLNLRGSQFGKVVIDPVALQAGSLRAFDGGSLVFEAPVDQTLYDLLTK